MLDPKECRILGLPVTEKVRYADDPDVIEAALLMRIEGRQDDTKGKVPEQARMAQDQKNSQVRAYLKDLETVDRRLASWATQNKL